MTSNIWKLVFAPTIFSVPSCPSQNNDGCHVSLQNDAGSRTRTTKYWENLDLVVVLVLESKGL